MSRPLRLSPRRVAPPLAAVLASVSLLAAAPSCDEDKDGSFGPDSSRIAVICPVELGLTEEDAAEPDWSGALRTWSLETRGDTLVLTRTGICGDECGFLEELALRDGGKGCPEVVYARRTKHEAGSPGGVRSDTKWAEVGDLKIQDWRPGEGAASGELAAEFRFTFYHGSTGGR
ncbi:MAG: hypothetical protein EHM19_02085 [Candidatus Latescibacterota bacterium]|nr:MAG: hypothetical protein EHM19_02085 [Candidatus Latescibacterota bacterium]